MMASSLLSATTTDANCQNTSSQQQQLQYSSSPSSQYLNNPGCDSQHDARFQQQQQQQRIYSQSHQQQVLQLPYDGSNCGYQHQGGSNQICSGGETNEEQSDVGAFVYQTIQTDNVPIVRHSSCEPDAQSMGQQRQQLQDMIQPVYENQTYLNQSNNNHDLISVRCFNNNNNNETENDSYYKFSSPHDASAATASTAVHYANTTQDDWKQRSLLLVAGGEGLQAGDDKTSFTIDSNNNNQPFQDQYPSSAQFAQDNNYTSQTQAHSYDSSSYHVNQEDSTCFVGQQQFANIHEYQHSQTALADHQQQQYAATVGPTTTDGSIISDQSCFPSSNDNSSPSSFQSIDQLQPTFTPSPTSATSGSTSKSKAARRKNPATISKYSIDN